MAGILSQPFMLGKIKELLDGWARVRIVGVSGTRLWVAIGSMGLWP